MSKDIVTKGHVKMESNRLPEIPSKEVTKGNNSVSTPGQVVTKGSGTAMKDSVVQYTLCVMVLLMFAAMMALVISAEVHNHRL